MIVLFSSIFSKPLKWEGSEERDAVRKKDLSLGYYLSGVVQGKKSHQYDNFLVWREVITSNSYFEPVLIVVIPAL